MIHISKVKLRQGFEVEHCTDLPRDEYGDADMDAAKYSYEDFANLEEAREYAKTVFKGSPFGCAMIRKFRMVPVGLSYPSVLEREYDESFFEEVS